MPAKSPAVADPKTELVPLCSVAYDADWPKRTRLLWIADAARWHRGQIPRVHGWGHRLPQYVKDLTGELSGDDIRRLNAQYHEDLTAAIQGVRELWTAALVELPETVTRPRKALRDGFSAHLSADAIDALVADITIIEDEAARLAETGGDASRESCADFVLEEKDEDILRACKKAGKTLVYADLAVHAECSEKTLKKRVPPLIAAGYLMRKTDRGGVAITQTGSDKLAMIPQKAGR